MIKRKTDNTGNLKLCSELQVVDLMGGGGIVGLRNSSIKYAFIYYRNQY